MAKHMLRVANGRELVEGEDYILFECDNCDKKIGFTSVAIRAILLDKDERLKVAELTQWAECGDVLH